MHNVTVGTVLPLRDFGLERLDERSSHHRLRPKGRGAASQMAGLR
jgi:hypothetical protein